MKIREIRWRIVRYVFPLSRGPRRYEPSRFDWRLRRIMKIREIPWRIVYPPFHIKRTQQNQQRIQAEFGLGALSPPSTTNLLELWCFCLKIAPNHPASCLPAPNLLNPDPSLLIDFDFDPSLSVFPSRRQSCALVSYAKSYLLAWGLSMPTPIFPFCTPRPTLLHKKTQSPTNPESTV
jgi:hypothetical protein